MKIALIDETRIGRLHDASFRILRNIGVRVRRPDAIRLLAVLSAAILACVVGSFASPAQAQASGHATYFVDPAKGDDANAGTQAERPWKSLERVNALKLAPGDKVVIAPGRHEGTLVPTGQGTAREPIVIEFLPGVHEFGVEKALRRPWFISNTNDAPTWPKPIAILVEGARHLRLMGGGVQGKSKTMILLGGRMMAMVNHQAEDISYSNLVFDLKRPTVSEFRVLETAANSVVVRVAEGSTYEIKNGKFAWTGDIGTGWVMAQQADLEIGRCWRMGRWDPFSNATAEDRGGNKVRLSYAKGTLGMVKGRQFQFRPTMRDMAEGVNDRCKDIIFSDCDIYALVNMSIVSQFTENVAYRRIRVAPPEDTLRTCPVWADAFHFSNCRGEVVVEDCVFSGLQDDPFNVHGTHLRIVGKPAENQLLLRFMHPQTYGFAAYAAGDEIAVISHRSLRELPGNPRRKVTACVPAPGDKTGKLWVITLDGPAPTFGAYDVVDNVSWYPNVTARNNFVTMDSCRGFLITTRGKALVEGNIFNRCMMPGILVEDDAGGWFESGPVRDMLIRGNLFVECGIEINPRTATPAEPVHENIRIEGNYFDGGGVSAHSVKGLSIAGNRLSGRAAVSTPNCQEVKTDDSAPKPGDADYSQPSPSARHNQKVAAVRSGDYDLALIGDSITHTLQGFGGKYAPLNAVWAKHYAPRRAINLGYSGYRTENILWNLQNGELAFARSPELFMILIGTNNADDRHFRRAHTAEEIFAGTKAIVDLIRQRHPTSKILVLRIFPRGGDSEKGVSPPEFKSSAKCIETCRRAGEFTRRLADGKQVFWLDINHVFLRPDGTINPDLMWDLLHPSPAGAEAWARAIEPTLARLMGDKPIVGSAKK